MPIYEFDCRGCGQDFDKLVRSANAVSEVACPVCDSHDVKKKLSVFSSRISGGSRSSAASASASCTPSGL
jgi:putative FmdB family regulatory protein